MELFHNNGHLTDEALKAMIDGAELDELARLEIAEHLSFCDECVLRYTDLLTDDALLQPPHSAAPGVLERIKKRARMIFFNKYTSMAACALLALTLWMTGVFSLELPKEGAKALASLNQRTTEISESAGNWLLERAKDFNNFFTRPERSSQP